MEKIVVQYDTSIADATMPRKHSHATYEIYYLHSGTRDYFIGDRVYKVNPGDFVLISSNVLHKTGGKAFERTVVYFDCEGIPEELFDLLELCFAKAVIRTHPEGRMFIEALLERMRKEYDGNGENRDMFLQSQLICLILEIGRFSEREAECKDDPSTNLIMNIVSHINKNYMEDLAVEGLAGMAYLSRSHFCRKFKKVTGFSPLEYINSVRINEAEKLLHDTRIPITEISIRTGFSSSNYFGDLFKKYKGVSPREWRRINDRQ